VARRRILLLSVLIVALAVASPATAAAPEGAPVEPPSMGELRRALESEIEALSAAPPPLADDGLSARFGVRMARADWVIGSARVGAAEWVAWSLPGLRLEVGDLIAGGPDLLRERAEHEGPLARWDMERTAREWKGLEALLERLRGIAAVWAPERVCPVGEETWFVNDWHDPRPGRRVHLGIDLHGEVGTPLLAVEAGTVIQANWHRSGGRQVFITADATGDLYFYAHLDAWSEWIWTGTRVEAGDVIGTLGRSGNATTPHLHFGWMPGTYRLAFEALTNPYPLLVEWCG
jgi:murein DD-endopeptidase MepM/ murein hydrolase activator NlpD